MGMKRDSGKAQAYLAERAAFDGYWFESGHDSAKLSEAEAREMVELLAPRTRVTFEGRRTSSAGFRRIEFYHNVEKLNVAVVLHEVAHVLTPDGHGPLWRAKFVELVREWIGPEKADRLSREFREQPRRRSPRKFLMEEQNFETREWAPAEDTEETRQVRKEHGSAMRRGWRINVYISTGTRCFRLRVVS